VHFDVTRSALSLEHPNPIPGLRRRLWLRLWTDPNSGFRRDPAGFARGRGRIFRSVHSQNHQISRIGNFSEYAQALCKSGFVDSPEPYSPERPTRTYRQEEADGLFGQGRVSTPYFDVTGSLPPIAPGKLNVVPLTMNDNPNEIALFVDNAERKGTPVVFVADRETVDTLGHESPAMVSRLMKVIDFNE
jgi:hypothetical protein